MTVNVAVSDKGQSILTHIVFPIDTMQIKQESFQARVVATPYQHAYH